VDAEVTALGEEPGDGVGHRADADLQRGAWRRREFCSRTAALLLAGRGMPELLTGATRC
jgi:hypothetical protein